MVDVVWIESLPVLAPRAAASHKGDFGRALLIGGSRGMSGAMGLAGMAALRGGAGLVRLAVPVPCLETVAGYEPSYMTTPLDADSEGRFDRSALDRALSLCSEADCTACGPGLGRSSALQVFVRGLYARVERPMVVDADALFALAGERPDAPPSESLTDAGADRILTPHPGEFRRLVGRATRDRLEMESLAIELARSAGVVMVLKGHGTLVTDGRRAYRNTTGNPGMATGGSGDVLTGLITALVCQGLEAFEAAQLGVYLHGRAGDLAAAAAGQTSLIASDLVRHLPAAICEHQRGP
ncbi:MAG: NAD(P)H-hydrate dehydratase [Pirellulales bacterium]